MHVRARFFFFLILLSAVSAQAQVPQEADFTIRDYHFSTGETLDSVRIHYATLGAPRRDSRGVVRNAVLILHGTGGSGQQFLTANFAGVLFGPGQLLDARRYYIILPDSIGHGKSSKPSDGLRMRFPHYTYDDMVDLQYRLLTEGLHVDHLFLVMGTSMGGMHTWMWGESHPDFMDGLVPLASAPTEIAGRNRVWRKMIIDDIRNDPGWNDGNYKTQPRGLTAAVHMIMIAGSSPLQMQKSAPTRDEADRFLEAQVKHRLETTDANDMLYYVEASRTYDPSPSLEKITRPLLAINSSDDFVNPPELGIVDALIRRVPKGRFIILPTTPETHGHSTHSYPAVWQRFLEKFMKTLRASS